MPKFSQDILKETEMDDEFKEIVEKYAVKEPTPKEMDLRVRMDRVIYVLNRTLAMIKMMMYLPLFLEGEAEILKKYIPSRDVHFILKLMNKFGYNFEMRNSKKNQYCDYSDVLEQTNVQKMPHKFSKHSAIHEPPSHPQVSQMINILFRNKCIRQLVHKADLDGIDRSVVDFLNTVEDLKRVVKDKIFETGEEEDIKDKELRQAFKHNVLVVASIKEMQARLEKQTKDLGDQLNKKVAIFTMYNKRMDKIKEDFQSQVESSLTASEKEMMNRTVISEEKQVYLAEEAKKVTKQYELLLEEHLGVEKVSRSKRFKAETQLHNWLIKYDQDIGDRQAEYEGLKAKYDEEKAEKDALEELFEDQEQEYKFLMQEKAEEEERIFNEMAHQFLINRSARRIQRTWRAYIQRKKARKKGKKGKGKGGKGGKGKGKGKEKDATKKQPSDKPDPQSNRTEDPNAALLGKNKKFKADVFDEIEDPHAFDKKDLDL